MKKTMLALLLAVAALTAGCTGQSESTDERTASYGNDGYMGLTNAHPGLGAAKQSHNYSRDAEVLRAAVADMPGVRNMRVFIDGGRANVHMDVDSLGRSKDEMRKFAKAAERKLRAAAPRYSVQLRLHTN